MLLTEDVAMPCCVNCNEPHTSLFGVLRSLCAICEIKLDQELEEAQTVDFPTILHIDDADEGDSFGAHLIRQYAEYT